VLRAYLRSDDRPEFAATAVLRWLREVGIETAHIAPGKSWQNGTDESFNGRSAMNASKPAILTTWCWLDLISRLAVGVGVA
jgi:transposase InsO family protein